MTDRDELLAAVEIGIEAESFLESKVGKHLTDRAESELNAALAALKDVDASKPDEVRKLQNQAWRAESVQTWLAEVIQSGWNAEEMLKAGDEG
jgi:hypothetical protein